jgi:hypothetical protein
MQETRDRQRREDGVQFVIAVFDDWEALQTVMGDLRTHELGRADTLLHARADNPPPAVISSLLKEITQLQFRRSNRSITCTKGEVADELAARLATGARSLADALHTWVSTDHAWQLQSHIEKGRIILWLQVPTSEAFGAVCGRLVQASPHMVGLCNINLKM